MRFLDRIRYLMKRERLDVMLKFLFVALVGGGGTTIADGFGQSEIATAFAIICLIGLALMVTVFLWLPKQEG